MVVQYPHTIKYNHVTQGEAYQNADGDWVVPEVTEAEVIQKCRLEVNGTGKKTAGEDGTLIEYGFAIYMPLDSKSIPFNQVVEVYNRSELIGKGSVKRFSRGQLNARAWV